MSSEKAATILQHAFATVVLAIVYFVAYLAVLGTLQGIVDSRDPEPISWWFGLIATVLAFPAFYILPFFGESLRATFGSDNNVIFVALGFNGFFWAAVIVGAFHLIVRFRSRRSRTNQSEQCGPENPIPSGTSDAKASGAPDSRGL